MILNQVQNANSFIEKNKDFAKMSVDTKKQLINDVIEDAVTENPIRWNPENDGNYTTFRSCAEQYAIDKDRCNRDCNVQGSFAIASFAFGPVVGGLAVLSVAITTSNCLKDAKADYNDCIK